jgi:hypothetical protein
MSSVGGGGYGPRSILGQTMKTWVALLSAAGNALSLQLFELSAIKSLNGFCEVVSFKPVQWHRNVQATEDTYIEHQILPIEPNGHVNTLVRVYGSTCVVLMDRLGTECLHLEGSHSLRDQLLLDNGAFDIEGFAPLPPSPILTITPLHISGPSENRIDLVFFADGCEYGHTHFPLTGELIVWNRPGIRRAEISGRCGSPCR